MNFDRTTALFAAAAVTLSTAGVSLAQNNQNNQGSQQGDSSDMAMVSIKRSSTWGFSNQVRELMSEAYEKMYSDPEVAIEKLDLAAGMTQILSAASSTDEGKQALDEAAAKLSEFAQKVQNRQVVNPDDLSRPAAQVALAIAASQHSEAKAALGRGEESGVAYSLESAADNLLQAHVYLKKQPTDDVAKAIYNADRLGRQLVALIEPTTQQGGQYAVTTPEEKSDYEDSTLLDNAQTAAGRVGGQDDQGGDQSVAAQIPAVTPQVIDALGQAIDSSKQAARQSGNN